MDLFSVALPALSDAMGLIFQPIVLSYLVLGVVMGLCIGVFPGLGGIAGLSLLLPFMFGMDPILGLALMIGMVAVVRHPIPLRRSSWVFLAHRQAKRPF